MKVRSSYWQLLPYLWPQWPLLVKGSVCILGFVLFTLLLPYLAGQVAFFVGQGNVNQIAYWLGLATLVFLVRGLFQYGQNIFMIAAALNMVLNLRKRVYAHLHKLGLDYFETTQTGDLTYRLTEDIDRVGEIVDKLSHQFVSNFLQLIAIPAYMLYLNWPLTLAGLLLAPLMAWLIGLFGQRLLVLSRQSQNHVSNLSAMLTEVFSGIRVVQAFAAQEYEVKRFNQEAERNRQAKYRAQQLKSIQFPVVGFLEAVSIMLLFLLGGWQISQGNLTAQGFISFLAAVALLIQPIDLMISNFNEYKQTEASVERIFELMARQPSLNEKPDAKELPRVIGKVEYCHVSFAYNLGEPVLKDLCLCASPGNVIALVGSSGAGKSTLINLLLRFYDPQSGQILIDDIDIRNVTLNSLRRQIGIVPQDITLFSGTIAQNIGYGQEELDLEAIQEAAKIANAHSFITQFSQGYHTWVGERGVNLSGGQRQRLAIARAIVHDPRILILDEATSALDSESEALVQEALERVMQNRTVFIIAHRLSSVRRADCILVLEQGQVVESGTHTSLLSKGGRYAHFYAQQFYSAQE
ncbi:ABC transporter ATP-binding protein [Fischerella thermalis]|jgi:ATP-binding cassette subfamily B protein|uniref:Xenobiotic-transporting ATPase n=1 Tax=Fischerella thermalis JSC-11 TaxID=741277 RepID=G6FYX8_9CYAN|nr:ABC transporter ATP-binding protein [Fischerella thermalis]PLZ96503.1 ABC transporter ATP-binding protein [Fischerella thermalis CCMEE 5196]PMB07057.1 ABC transporter ATP-binding protein [Fischerella thermalis CCMEE 5328]PMB10585.1 ABC transporter ATP-binding protein [Fischerella thermalis CCMEE 5273]PMB52962.1 ABC transporter ATP-binding protein [Fischerella thermalis CCMEE 5201]EHC09440.1 Xenobiotic-transporting ATPase [Fischerella thermalis JSC-11]